MPEIYLNGEYIQVNKSDFVVMMKIIIEGVIDLPPSIYYSHKQGFPDYAGNLWIWAIQEYIAQLASLLPNIEDEVLKDLITSLITSLRKLKECDDNLTTLVAKSVGLPLPQSEKDRNRLKKTIDRRLEKNTGPFWMFENPDQYNELVKETELVAQQIKEGSEAILQRIDICNAGESGGLSK